MLQPNITRTTGSMLLACIFFILISVPKLNISLGPIPIYIIDVLIVFVFIQAVKSNRNKRKIVYPFQKTILLIIPFAIIGEILTMGYSGQVFEPIYIMIRTLLAFSLAFSIPIIIKTENDIKLLLKAAAIGLFITSILMILTSLPFTRIVVIKYVFSNSFLEPSYSQVLRVYLNAPNETGVRGRTLVGVSILGATFINAAWPLAVILIRNRINFGVIGKSIAIIGCFIAPIAVVMSYSRGPILGTILIMIAVLTMGLRHIRRTILLPLTFGIIIFATVGIGSKVFLFDRLITRTEAAFTDPYSDKSESERILSYVEPFEHVLEHPQFFFFGEGNAILKVNVAAEQDGKANHAMFAKAYYSYGMITAFIYMYLMIQVLYFSYKHCRRDHVNIPMGYNQALFLSVIALVPWVLFGHAMISIPRGAMLFFFVIGLVAAQRNFSSSDTKHQ